MVTLLLPKSVHRPSLPGLSSRSLCSLALFPAGRRQISGWHHQRRPSSGTCRDGGRATQHSRSMRTECTLGLMLATVRSSQVRCYYEKGNTMILLIVLKCDASLTFQLTEVAMFGDRSIPINNICYNYYLVIM